MRVKTEKAVRVALPLFHKPTPKAAEVQELSFLKAFRIRKSKLLAKPMRTENRKGG